MNNNNSSNTVLSKEFIRKYKNKQPKWGFNGLGYIVYKRTYARLKEDGNTEEWHETIERCINGAQKIGAGYTKEEAEKLFDYIFNLKCNFAGRMLWQLGTSTVDRFGANSLLNCLRYNTRVLTRQGWKEIGTLAGQEVEIVTKNGKWVKAPFKSYGEQQLYKTVFADKTGKETTIYSTPEHRWFILDKNHNVTEEFTKNLRSGKVVPVVRGKNSSKELSPQGIQHGLVFGDGSCNGYESFVDLIDATYDECKNYFGLNRISWTNPDNSRHVRFGGMPNYYKQLPDINENKQYLSGFLAGWIAADGSVNKANKTIRLFNCKKENLEFARDIAAVLGYRTSEPYLERDYNPFDSECESSELWSIKFYSSDNPHHLIIRNDHRSKLDDFERDYNNWAKVISNELTDLVETVYCAEVPDTHSFVIDGNILTGNCWFTSINEPKAFLFLFENLMLGGGVGFSIRREDVMELPKIKKDVVITHLAAKDADFIVPDTREGWVKLLENVLNAFYVTGKSFTYSTILIRGAGEKINGFGGKASGPGILIEGMTKITAIFQSREGKKLRSIDALDICNIIGSIVVAGNVRRSAEIALGDPDDILYMRAKNWATANIPNWRGMSNNTLYVDDYSHLMDEFWTNGYEINPETGSANGEPYGFFNLPLSQKYGRLKDGPMKDSVLYPADMDNVVGTNPCGEISLSNYECCVTYNTPIITENGVVTIGEASDKKQKIKVWNGEKWSEVSPHLTRKSQKILKIYFSDGTTLETTEDHRFSIADRFSSKDGYREVMAKDLLQHSKYKVHTQPFTIQYTAGQKMSSAYTIGFATGDGHCDGDRTYIVLYGDKDIKCPVEGTRYSVLKKEKYNVISQQVDTTKFVDVDMLKSLKNDINGFDRVFSWDRNSILMFIAGLADSDGAIQGNGIRIYISDEDRAKKLQLLLTKCGIQSSVNLFQKTGTPTNLSIRNRDLFYVQIPRAHEIPCKRLSIENCNKPVRGKGKYQIIEKIEELEGLHDVYCFNEPEKHMAVFNNTLTYQCNLCELYLNNIESEEELNECAKLLYKSQKAIASLPFIHEETTKIVHKNMRLGLGVTGICQSFNKIDWLDKCYVNLRKFDKEWSKQRGWPESIKLTTVKPSGTLSLLGGATPGIHPAYSKHYFRTIRMSSSDKLVQICKDLGYHTEFLLNFDGSQNHDTMVVYFPCETPDGALLKEDANIIDQLNLVKKVQNIWSDNAVSITAYYKPEELGEIKEWLKENYKNSIKSVSFLLHKEHGFKQAPYQEIDEATYLKAKERVKPLPNLNINAGEVLVGIECEGGACPIR